jgi:hypothetical protein
LSAGTFGGAAILLCSGIGPAAQVRRGDIEVVADHPFYLNVHALRPEPRGIRPVEPRDQRRLLEGVKLSRRIARDEPMASVLASELTPR